MIDTHCHLYESSFVEDFDAVQQRAKDAGVKTILLPNIDQASWAPLLNTIDVCEIPCFPMLGLHPCYVKTDYSQQLDWLETQLKTHIKKVVAIGEIGIDLYWDPSTLEAQKKALSRQIDWALTFDLPIALHVRDAFDPLFSVLQDYIGSPLRGVFHCFTGEEKELNYILRNHPSFYFGIGGVLTYKKSGLRDIVTLIPPARILLETDAPYLPPTPHRGKRNEPSYMIHVAETLSCSLGVSLEEIIRLSSENAENLFKLKQYHEA